MSTSNSPCAACKFLRRKCTQECVFAPYFPPDQPMKFANVHKVFGASNVSKLLIELDANQRADAVQSLAYEAEARLQDPVYGCVGTISILQHKLKLINTDLHLAKQELASYIGSSSIMPMMHAHMQQYIPIRPAVNTQPTLSLQGCGTSRDAQYQQQLYEAHEQQRLIEAAREMELLRNFQQQQQPSPTPQSANQLNFNSYFDTSGPSGQVNNTSRFNQLSGPWGISPTLALNGSYDANIHHHQQQQQQYQYQQQHQQQQQLLEQQQLQLMPPPRFPPQQHHGDDSRGGGTGSIGPFDGKV